MSGTLLTGNGTGGYSFRVTGALLDRGQPFDDHIGGRLDGERVIWLGSVRPDGRPHQVPGYRSGST